MKTNKKAKDKFKKAKNSIRVIGKVPEKVKKGPTGELELFKKIAKERASVLGTVRAKHIGFDGKECTKIIFLQDLTPTNFSHIIPKSRGEKYRLDPDNIEIVSVAWHFYEHNKQILQTDLPN